METPRAYNLPRKYGAMSFCLVLALHGGPLSYAALVDNVNAMLSGHPSDLMRAALEERRRSEAIVGAGTGTGAGGLAAVLAGTGLSENVKRLLRHSSLAQSMRHAPLPAIAQHALLSACEPFDTSTLLAL